MIRQSIIKFWEKLSSNKAFFMPTVTIYVLMLISFMMWYTADTLNLLEFENSYKDETIDETAMIKMSEIVNKNLQLEQFNSCTKPHWKLNDKNLDYSINIDVYCLRQPLKTDVFPETVVAIKREFNKLLRGNSKLNDVGYKEKKNLLLQNYLLQKKYEYIGIPFDFKDVAELVETEGISILLSDAEYQSIKKMPRDLVYDISITTNKKEHECMLIYSLENKRPIKIYYT